MTANRHEDPDVRFDRLAGPRQPNGCRLWRGRLKKDEVRGGYPHFRLKDPVTRRWRTVLASRYALERKLGRPIRPGYDADHVCHIRGCVAEEHLEEKTHQANLHNRRCSRLPTRERIERLWQRDRIAALVLVGKAETLELELIDEAIAISLRNAQALYGGIAA